MIRSKALMDQLIRRIVVLNVNSHSKLIEYRAWLPSYNLLFDREPTGFFIPVQIIYNAVAFNATVSIIVDPYKKILPKDKVFRLFQGMSYRRTEDEYSATTGIYYACKRALQIGGPEFVYHQPDSRLENDMYEYRDPKLVPFQLDLWRSVRAFVQATKESYVMGHRHYIAVPCDVPLS
jgi:hypothetical protein